MSLSTNDTPATGFKIQVSDPYLMVVTKEGIIRIWDVSKRDMRSHCHPINVREKIGDFANLEDVQMNCNGSFVSITIRPLSDPSTIDPKLYIYEIEKDCLRYFNFASGQNDSEDTSVPPNSAQSHIRSSSPFGVSPSKLVSTYVLNHYWDGNENNFLACYVKPSSPTTEMPGSSTTTGTGTGPEAKSSLISLFVHEDLGVVIHGSQPASENLSKLVAVEIPFLITLELKEDSMKVIRNVMSDFVGLEESDKATRDAVIKFSFYLSIGNMEEAFKSIKMIKNQNVWGNLARMCVKSQRLDVAAICLGKMEHAAGARALRQINAQNVHQDVKTAVLAVYLGKSTDPFLHHTLDNFEKNIFQF